MGRALARRMAERGDQLFLLGRTDDVQKSARDLERPETFEPALRAADAALGGFDTVVVTGGLFAPQDDLEADPELMRRVLVVDFAHTVLFCEHARKRLLASGKGT